ncbi:MAG: PAS domain S-box protein [Gemmatimonadaceae bacterium]|nr:PAS domain S-box protein [Gemmatimonadaceae bacterium]
MTDGSPVSLEAVLCTEELHRRPARVPDYETENRLLRALTQALVDSPRTILQTLAENILEGLGADSAGVSLLAEDNKSFFWPAIAGAWAQHVGGGTPRDFGPCGDVLDRNTPLLFTHLERRYSYFVPTTPPAEECLLVPFYIAGKAVGAIWAIAHDSRRKFDAEDLRQLESLGGFASAAYQAETKTATEQRRAARELAEAVQAGQEMEALHAKLLASHDALRRSEGDLRDFVDNAAVGLHWVGADGSILWANQTELDLLGYTRDEYFGQQITDFHADESVIADILARLTLGETLHDYEARLRCKDGSIRHVVISSNTLFEHDKFVHTRCFTRDITDRKQAEETLRENEWRLRYAMESARLTYVEVHLPRGEARTADNFAAVMGYPAPSEQEVDVAAGTRLLLEHVVPHDRQRVDEALQQFTEGNPVGTVQYRVLGDDRIERWIESRWTIQFGPDSESRKSFATNLDITELKQVEAALRMSEERGRLALDSAELGTFSLDPATNILASDERFNAIFGTPTERIDYEQAIAIAHPDDRSRIRGAVAAAIRCDDPVPLLTECRVIHPNGTVRWVLAKGRAHFVQHGLVRTLTSLDGTVADITERKLAEDALRESEAFNRSIVESSPDCIKVLGLDGTLLSLLRGQELLGIEDEELFLNTSWFDLWEGEHRRAAQSAVAVAATGGAGSFVGFFRTFRGEPKWWDVAISPILDAGGKPARLLAVSRDVTQRKRGELNLEFLASVSHDLLHLTSVDGMLQTVGAKIGAFLDLSICAFAEISETAEEVVIVHDWHRADAMGLVGVYPLTDFVGPEFIRVARSGEIIVVRDTVTDPRTDPETFAALKIASFICAPLILHGQWRFALCLYRPAACDWREDEIELAREVTARVWTRLERLRAEELLRESEERYRYLFNSIDEGFCVIELMFDEREQPVDYRFLEVNPSFENQSGLHNALGRRIRELVPELEASWFARYGNVAVTGDPVRFINESKTLVGWFDVYAFRIGGQESRKVAVIFNNITERTKVEQALRESAEALADLDRRKDEFLAMLGHELRNPLAPLS